MIEKFLQSIHPIEHDILRTSLEFWEPIEASRKEVMTRAGDHEKYMYLVLEGIQKYYSLADGKEHVMAFTYAPSFSGVPDSFITGKPSHLFLECITPSKFLRISHAKHLETIEKFREIETLHRKATEMILAGMIQRHWELLALNMEERYRIFVGRSASLINQIPHKDLASYLRIDPTNFSKLFNTIKL